MTTRLVYVAVLVAMAARVADALSGLVEADGSTRLFDYARREVTRVTPSADGPTCVGKIAGKETAKFQCTEQSAETCSSRFSWTGREGHYVQCGVRGRNCVTVTPCARDISTLPRDCREIYDDDNSAEDGEYRIYLLGAMSKVYCLMSYGKGGYTAVARAIAPTSDSYDPPPPSTKDGAEKGGWAEWAAHRWRSGDSYYFSLQEFDNLTNGETELVMMNIEGGNQTNIFVYKDVDYNATANNLSIGSAEELPSNRHNWTKYPPNFVGPGNPVTPNCASEEDGYYNYMNFADCASDSGLFAHSYSETATTPKPQKLGQYRQHVEPGNETLILVRSPPAFEPRDPLSDSLGSSDASNSSNGSNGSTNSSGSNGSNSSTGSNDSNSSRGSNSSTRSSGSNSSTSLDGSNSSTRSNGTSIANSSDVSNISNGSEGRE